MIPSEQIAALAELYDGFAHAFKPLSKERSQAGIAFRAKLEELRLLHAPRHDARDFQREAIRQCKLFLRKN